MKARLYHAGELVKQWDAYPGIGPGSIASEIGQQMAFEIYDEGYLRLGQGNLDQVYPWRKCDLTPLHLHEVPTEIRVLDMLLG